MLKTALIILTVSATGQTHMALTYADSVDDCRDTAEMIGDVLTESGISIAAMRCGQTELDLTEFIHGFTEDEMRWHYHVTVNGAALEDGFVMEHVAPGTCESPGASTYCTISAQYPVEE